MDLPAVTESQRALLDVVYDGLRQASAWPSTEWVDARLDRDRGLDLETALTGMPRGLVNRDPGYGPSSTVRLTIPGASLIPAGREDCGYLVSLLGWLAEREREHDPGPPTAPVRLRVELSEVVAGAWGGELPRNDGLNPVLVMGQTDGLFNVQIQRVQDGDEELEQVFFDVDRTIRPYRGVGGVDEYIALRPEPTTPPRGVRLLTSSNQLSSPLIDWPSFTYPTNFQTIVPLNMSEPDLGGLYIFVLMPFTEEWSSNVWDVIDGACERVGRQYDDVTWERASEMTAAGRITDQILSAIERASLVIADVTGSNANVMFELGYAAALDRPIILLNQAVAESPFDIKDWRQVVYSVDKLAEARAELVRHLDGNLRRLSDERTARAEH